MHRVISEPDWKIWKPLFEVALERFCQRTLDGAARYAAGEGTAHERYVKLYQYVKKRDKELGQVFDNLSRSNAPMQIALAAKKKLITPEELAAFSQETQDRVALLLG
jgi:hypothetical protein